MEEEEQNLSAEGRKALEEDLAGASVFLPFPLTTHTVRPPPYSGKDPEWKEFTKLSQDRPMRKKISGKLVDIFLPFHLQCHLTRGWQRSLPPGYAGQQRPAFPLL